MLGWFSAAAAFASCSKRCSRCGSEEKDAGRTLIATSRFNRGSRARYTSPIPPAPIADTISYGPRRVSLLIAILETLSVGGDYKCEVSSQRADSGVISTKEAKADTSAMRQTFTRLL